MQPYTPDLFEDHVHASPLHYAQAFDDWLQSRERQGGLREPSSVAVYRSMWSALTQWCVARGLQMDHWQPGDLQAFLSSRGAAEELTARHAWRLLMLADAVQTHRNSPHRDSPPRNTAARTLLLSTPAWRYANAADKTPLPEHLHAAQARQLVAWLMDPASGGENGRGSGGAGAQSPAWQSLRNRTAVALQLGAGLTPGDIRAATVDGVICSSARAAGLPWKVRIPAHGSAPAREAPLAPWAARLLRTWLDTRSALQMAGPVLFPATRAGRPWGKVAQYGAAKAVLAAAGVPDGDGGSFKLRHTFALRQLRRGTSPQDVAQWLGLSNVAALARYQRVLVAPVDVV
jgi:site-specific recombinase XerD